MNLKGLKYIPVVDPLRQRIAELEAEVDHYKEWLKERTSELQAQLDAQVESDRLINAGAGQRIAELETDVREWKQVIDEQAAELVRLRGRIGELGADLGNMAKRNVILMGKNKLQQERTTELMDFVRDYLRIGHTVMAARAKALLPEGEKE